MRAESMNGRFRLVSDDDGHHYVIPEYMKDAWNLYLDGDAESSWETPVWAQRLGMHPSCLTFSDPQEE